MRSVQFLRFGVLHTVLKDQSQRREGKSGLVWRDFVLEDGRVIPEHKVLHHPEPPVWRNPEDVNQAEREAWEIRLVSMAEAGLDPHYREQSFWAELNQYLAYTYLRYKHKGESG